MPNLNIKIELSDQNVIRTYSLNPECIVSKVCEMVRDKEFSTDTHERIGQMATEWGLYLSEDDPKKGVWLEPHRNLEYYLLKEGDLLEYKRKIRPLRVKMMDDSIKTILVDDSQLVSQLMITICCRIGISNYEEYSLVREYLIDPNYESVAAATLSRTSGKAGKKTLFPDHVYGTLSSSNNNPTGPNKPFISNNSTYATLPHAKSNGPANTFDTLTKNERKMEQMKRKLHTDDEINWIDQSKTLREQGIEESEILLLRRKYFYSDQNVDSHDPVQLNLLYVQCRDAIINGTHPVTLDQACKFAGIQCQIQYCNYDSAKHKPGFLELEELAAKDFRKLKGTLEKRIFIEHANYRDINEIECKVEYVKLARALKTYGVTFFLVKEKVKGKNKLRPRLLGVTKESVLKLDENTKEILKNWPLTRVKRWGATPHSFTLDFGDYQDSYYSVQTNEGEKISGLISGYIDIILKNRKQKRKGGPGTGGAFDGIHTDENYPYQIDYGCEEGVIHDEESTLVEEIVSPHRATYVRFLGSSSKSSPRSENTSVRNNSQIECMPAPDSGTRSGKVYFKAPAHPARRTILLLNDPRNRECLNRGILRIGSALRNVEESVNSSSDPTDSTSEKRSGSSCLSGNSVGSSSLKKANNSSRTKSAVKRRVRFVEDKIAHITANSAKIVAILSSTVNGGEEGKLMSSTCDQLSNQYRDADGNLKPLIALSNGKDSHEDSSLRDAITEVSVCLEELLKEMLQPQDNDGSEEKLGSLTLGSENHSSNDNKNALLNAVRDLAEATFGLLDYLKLDDADLEKDIADLEAEKELTDEQRNKLDKLQTANKHRVAGLAAQLTKVGECGARLLNLVSVQDLPTCSSNQEVKRMADNTNALMGLAKNVANSAAHLVLRAKHIANDITESTPVNESEHSFAEQREKRFNDRERIVSAATRCAMKTSELITCIKVMAPTMQSEICKNQTILSAQYVTESVDKLVMVGKDISHNAKLNDDLGIAAQQVIQALDNLIDFIKFKVIDQVDDMADREESITSEADTMFAVTSEGGHSSSTGGTGRDVSYIPHPTTNLLVDESILQPNELKAYRDVQGATDVLLSSINTQQLLTTSHQHEPTGRNVALESSTMIQQARIVAQATADLVAAIKFEAHKFDTEISDLMKGLNEGLSSPLVGLSTGNGRDSKFDQLSGLECENNRRKKDLFDSAKRLAEATTKFVECAKRFTNTSASSSNDPSNQGHANQMDMDGNIIESRQQDFVNAAFNLKHATKNALGIITSNRVLHEFKVHSQLKMDFQDGEEYLKPTLSESALNKDFRDDLKQNVISIAGPQKVSNLYENEDEKNGKASFTQQPSITNRELFIRHRDDIIGHARKLVEDSKMLVTGCTTKIPNNNTQFDENGEPLKAGPQEDHIAAAGSSAVRTLAQLGQRVKLMAHEFYGNSNQLTTNNETTLIDASSPKDNLAVQTLLLDAIKDIATALGDLIQAAKQATNKDHKDPQMNYLKESAKVMVTNVTSLLKTLKQLEESPSSKGFLEVFALQNTIQSLHQELRIYDNYESPISSVEPQFLIEACRKIMIDMNGLVTDIQNGTGPYDIVSVIGQIVRHHVGDVLRACQGISHHYLLHRQDLKVKLLDFGREICLKYIAFLEMIIKDDNVAMLSNHVPLDIPDLQVAYVNLADCIERCENLVAFALYSSQTENKLSQVGPILPPFLPEGELAALEINEVGIRRYSPNTTERELLSAASSIEKVAKGMHHYPTATPPTKQHLKRDEVETNAYHQDLPTSNGAIDLNGNTEYNNNNLSPGMLNETESSLNGLNGSGGIGYEMNGHFVTSFDERIINAAQTIAHASASLIRAACAAQRELIRLGIIQAHNPQQQSPHYYDQDGQWSHGLISAARHVVAATRNMCTSADAFVKGFNLEQQSNVDSNPAGSQITPTEDKLAGMERVIIAAKQVASGTTQLTLACKVKAGPYNPVTSSLEKAGTDIKRATECLISIARQSCGIVFTGNIRSPDDYHGDYVEDYENYLLHQQQGQGYYEGGNNHEMPSNSNIVIGGIGSATGEYIQGKGLKRVGTLAQEMEAQQEILRKERELEEARVKLGVIRKAKYYTAAVARNNTPIHSPDCYTPVSPTPPPLLPRLSPNAPLINLYNNNCKNTIRHNYSHQFSSTISPSPLGGSGSGNQHHHMVVNPASGTADAFIAYQSTIEENRNGGYFVEDFHPNYLSHDVNVFPKPPYME